MLGSILGAITAATISSAAENVAGSVLGGVITYVDGKKYEKNAEVQMKRMDMIMRENPENYVQMRLDNSALINQNYYDVVKNLAGMGFYDIVIREVLTAKGLFDKPRTGLVSGVAINGARIFDSLSIFPRDAHVIVETIVHKGDNHLYMPELAAIRQGAVMRQRPVMRCEYCGVAITQGQKFCIGCGAPL